MQNNNVQFLNYNNLDTVISIIRSNRRPNEDNNSLVQRILKDTELIMVLVNSEPFCNASILTSILQDSTFIQSL